MLEPPSFKRDIPFVATYDDVGRVILSLILMKVMAMRYLVLLIVFLCASCSSTLPGLKPYHLDVQQGNVVTSKMMLQLKPGMTKSQVRYVMGTPLLQDSFHQDRWDYIYQMNKGGEVVERRRVILEFNNEGLAKIRGDVIPAGSPGAENAPMANVEDVKSAKSDKTLLNEDPKKSWTERFKFWKDDEKAGAEKSVAAPEKDTKKEESKAGWFSSLKFWGSEDKTKVTDVPVKQEAVVKSVEALPVAPPVEEVKVEVAPEVVAPVDEKTVAIAGEVDVPAEIAHAKEVVPVTPPVIEKVDPAPVAPIVKPEAPVKGKVPAVKKPAKKAQRVEPVNEEPQQTEVEPKLAIGSMVNAWVEAWRTKNLNGYFKCYSDKFAPEGMTRQAWVAKRKQRIAGQPGAIELSVEKLSIDVDAKTARVEFLQHYSNGKFSDHVVKELKLAVEQNTWVILKESVLSKSTKSDVQMDGSLAGIPTVRKTTTDEKSEAMPEKMLQESAKEAVQYSPEVKPEPIVLPQETMPEPVKSEQTPPLQDTKPKESVPAPSRSETNKDNPLPPEGASGYFERMLEKIGF